MGIVDWLTRTLGKDLDRDVHGTAGTAQVRYPGQLSEAALVVRARLGAGARGPLTLIAQPPADAAARPTQRRANDTIEADLGPGRLFRSGALTVAATVTDAPDRAGLVALTLELLEVDDQHPAASPVARESYSVESRLDEAGHARLEIRVQLG